MSNLILKLQLFGEGGEGAVGSTDTGSTETESGLTEEVKKTTRKGRSNPLQDVVYGKQPQEELTADSPSLESTQADPTFDELIKGKYKEDFEKRTQSIINKRFKETKGLEEKLKSHDQILNLLADKYGIENDVEKIAKALEDDESFYEQEAMEKGLSVKQLKELKSLKRQNDAFKAKEEEAKRRENSNRIYSEWTKQAEELKAKYSLNNFSLEEEVNNPDFVSLLSSGISLENAYKAIHMDEMIGGAMAKTASTVREKLSNSIQSRSTRPAENGINTTSSKTFKTDVKSLTRKDREEIARRVARGEKITF